jgi:DNA-binding MarR family transcriptional regulator
LNIGLDVFSFILIGTFFIIGFLISYILKIRKTTDSKTAPIQQDNNLEIIELLENKKQLQIDNITIKLNDIQIKLDLLEAKLSSQSENRPHYVNSSRSNINENIISDHNHDNTSQHNEFNDITHKSLSKISYPEKTKNKFSLSKDKHTSTEHYILNIILEDSLTSNEIKKAIGKTREHTSRLLKKLFELKLVDRDTTTKPFRYKLTEQGKKYIEEQVKNKEINYDNSLNSSYPTTV